MRADVYGQCHHRCVLDTAEPVAGWEQQLLVSDIVNAQASAIERRLSRSLSTTWILAQEVRRNGGQFEDFDSFAAEVIESVGGVSNLQLAPDGVIRRIYPLSGNERALGHNILRDDQRRAEAQLAVAEKRLTLAGPFELLQGGVAVTGRNPVYLHDGGAERFWGGGTSALIFLDDLLAVTELDQLNRKGYSYRLSRTHPVGGEQKIFARSESDLSTGPLSVKINVPSAVWVLAMSRAESGTAGVAWTGYVASVLVGLMLAYMLNGLLRQPARLQQLVRDKTRELEEIALHDYLTGLPNRRCLGEQLARLSGLACSDDQCAALLYFDLDDFKRFNDSMGHSAGDVLLQQVARRLRDCVGDQDLVARLGGDEFALLLRDVESKQQVADIAGQVLRALEKPVAIELREFTVSTSIGITLIPADGDQVTSLRQNADMAMYQVRAQGKGRFCFYDQAMQVSAIQRLRIEEDLQDAVRKQQLVLHYQPQVDLQADRGCGFEALVRWQHPLHGLMFPDSFVSVAEDTGKIVEIGYWVLARPVRRYSRGRRAALSLCASVSICHRGSLRILICCRR